MENIVAAIFKVESQAYQSFSELKRDLYNGSYTISELSLVKKQNGHIELRDSFDVGFQPIEGGLVGSVIGILGGPLGVLLGASVGALAGSAAKVRVIDRNESLAERVTTGMKDGDVALIALVQEKDDALLDSKLKKYDTVIMRRDAATVEDEVKEAKRIQKELEKQAKKELRAQKTAERKAKIEKQKVKIKKAFDEFKQKQQKLAGAKSSSK